MSNDLGQVFSCDLYDLASSENYPTITGTTIQKIEVNKKENSYAVESNEESSTGWFVTDEAGDKKEADATNAGTLQSTIAGLSYSGYYNYNCVDWSEYGLDDPKMTIYVDYTEQVQVEDEETEEESDEKADTETE